MRSQRALAVGSSLAIDGISDDIKPIFKNIDSYKLGICKLEYDNGIFHIYLRRPGLLIGLHGNTIEAVQKHLGVSISIHEVDLLK